MFNSFKDNNLLNDEQKYAGEQILQFLLSDETEMILSGPAGAGKSFLLKYLKEVIFEKYQNICKALNTEEIIKHIEFTATTNKAALGLQSSTDNPVTTIHSYIGLKVTEDYKTGKTHLSLNNSNVVRKNTLIIIDEYSMITSELYKYINLCKSSTTKILYVGDSCQLLGVGSNKSVIEDNPNIVTRVELNTIMRSKGNPKLTELILKLRENVRTNTIITREELQQYVQFIGVNQLKELMNVNFLPTDHKSIFLSYTNKVVNLFNTTLRNFRGFKDTFEKNEKLINNSLSKTLNSKISLQVDEEVEIINTHTSFHCNFNNINGLNVRGVTVKNSFDTEVDIVVPSDIDEYKKLLTQSVKDRNWNTYFELKKIPDLRPKDARTTYKAQGDTFDWIVIHINDILSCTHINQVIRLLYVAISRAKDTVYIYDNKME